MWYALEFKPEQDRYGFILIKMKVHREKNKEKMSSSVIQAVVEHTISEPLADAQSILQRQDWRNCPRYKELSWQNTQGRRKVLVNILKKFSVARLCGTSGIGKGMKKEDQN